MTKCTDKGNAIVRMFGTCSASENFRIHFEQINLINSSIAKDKESKYLLLLLFKLNFNNTIIYSIFFSYPKKIFHS